MRSHYLENRLFNFILFMRVCLLFICIIFLEFIIVFKVIAFSYDILLCSFRIKIVVLHLWLFMRNPLLILHRLSLQITNILPLISLRRTTLHEGSLDVLWSNLYCLHLKIFSISIVQGNVDDDFGFFLSEGKIHMLLIRIG